MSARALVSVVVPLLNEAANVPELRRRLTQALAAHEFECLLVDDGSTDATTALARDLAREDARFKLVRLSRNFGHQAAIVAGLTFARGACVAVLDGDLQDPPELLPEMLRAWAEGAEVVYGVRAGSREGWLRRVLAAAYYRVLARLAATPLPLDAADFAVMDRRVVNLIVTIGERRPYVRGLRTWVGFRQAPFPYVREQRARGRSKYTLTKLLDLALAGLVSFSVAPLRPVALGGALLALLCVAGGVLLLVQRGLAAGAAGVIVLAGFLFGIQLLVLGLLGEYLGRVLEEVRRRPIFVVDEVVGLEPAPDRRPAPPAG